ILAEEWAVGGVEGFDEGGGEEDPAVGGGFDVVFGEALGLHGGDVSAEFFFFDERSVTEGLHAGIVFGDVKGLGEFGPVFFGKAVGGGEESAGDQEDIGVAGDFGGEGLADDFSGG